MADKKISQLTAASTPLAGTEVLPIVQSGSTVKVSVDNLTAGKTVSASGLNVQGTVLSGVVDALVKNNGTDGTSSTRIMSSVSGASGGDPKIGLIVTGERDYFWYIDNSDSDKLKLDSNGSDLLSVDTSGNMTLINSNFVVGTAGKGIDFSANTGAAGETSALLNWYEEGTWTPDLKFGGGNTSMTYSYRNGRYTRIGRMVYITMAAVLTAKGSSTGNATIEGLPFAPTGFPTPTTINTFQYDGQTGMNFAYLATGTTTYALTDVSGNALTDATFTDTTTFRINGFYLV